VKLSATQQESWQKMTAKFAKTNNAMDKLMAEKQDMIKNMESFQEEEIYLLQARERSGEGIHCEIKEIVGDTLVRTLVAYNGTSEFVKFSASELRIKLHEQGFSQERVFFGETGNLDWQYALPELV
jgi:hypothetical protein